MSRERASREGDADLALRPVRKQSPATHVRHNDSTSREKKLQAELAQLKQMNTTLDGLNKSLVTAKTNLDTMQTNMTSAKALLKTWTRILNQAEHNQRLILNPDWPGATQDLQDIENEDTRRQEEAEQKIQEEARRREEAQRKLEADVRRREEADRSRGRGLNRTRSTRGTAGSTRGSTASSRGTRGTSTRGVTSGIARGVPARGRGRG